MAKKRGGANHPIEYCAPPRAALRTYAREICAHTGRTSFRFWFRCPEIVEGLAEFMKIAGTIQAKHLNRTQGVDNAPK